MMKASLLLEKQGLSLLTRSVLLFCELLDRYGAWKWSLRTVALVSFAMLGVIRLTFQKKRGVDWYALTHALVSSVGSMLCVYLDLFAAEALTGTPEPLRSVLCQGPLTSLHRILPAITAGYSLFDLIDGLTISIDFALHGASTLAVMIFFCEAHAPNLITPMLLMEVSTIFLTVVRYDGFSDVRAAINQGLFALTFFVFRCVFVPYIWVQIMIAMYEQRRNPEYQSCHEWYLFPVSMAFGGIFHSLNAYWFIKIVKKIRRKMTGEEHIHANNDLAESEMKKKTS